jgi:ribose transport system substrate-binding protein
MNSNKSIRWLTSFLFVLSFVLAGCAPAKPAEAPAPKAAAQIVIGISLSNMANPFFVSIEQGAQEAANRLDATLVVKDAQDDTSAQAKQVQELIDQKVDILLINPVDSEAIGATIQTANTAGIPVITIDRSANSGSVVSHIASDNTAGGLMAGNYLAELMEKSGNVVELKGIEGTSAAKDRGAGFNEAISKHSGIKVIAHEVADFDQAKGKEVFAALLTQYPEINGVFAHNDSMILGAMEAAQEAGRKDIIFVGFDAVDDAVQAVEDGSLSATVAQQPVEIGRLGVETAVEYLNGQTIAKFIPVELALVHR